MMTGPPSPGPGRLTQKGHNRVLWFSSIFNIFYFFFSAVFTVALIFISLPLHVRRPQRQVDIWGGNSVDKGGGNSSDNGGSNISDKGGGNISDKGGGNMAVRVGSSSISGSVRVSIAVDQSRVSLSFTLANMTEGESAHEGGGVCTTIDTIGPGV